MCIRDRYYSEALHTQPAYSGVCSYDKEMLNAVRLPASVLSLPIYGNISDIDQEVIVDTIRTVSYTHLPSRCHKEFGV